MKGNFFVVLLFLCILGCASKQKSLAEIEDTLKTNEAASTRVYPGKTSKQVREAAYRVLFLLDPPDMEFSLSTDNLLATRSAFFYNIFSVVYERDWYVVQITEAPEGTVAKFSFQGESHAFMPITKNFKENIPISPNIEASEYAFFHDRLEYVLGLRDSWPTCSDLKKRLVMASSLCQGLGIDDKEPEWQKGQGTI